MKYRDSYISNKSFFSKLIIYILMQLKIRVFNIPTRIILYVTDRCNARCEHCFFWRQLNNKSEPTIQQIEKLTNSLPVLDTISLTGGEPFMRKDLFDIIKILSRKSKKIAISTNGSFTDNIIKLIKNVLNELDIYISIQVSIDGIGKTHDRIRGVPIYNKVIKTLTEMKRIQHERFSFNTLTVITNHNYKEIENIAKVIRDEIGVNTFFEFVRGKPRNASVLLPPANEMKNIIKKLHKIYSKNEKDPLLLYLDKRMLDAEFYVYTYNKPFHKCLAGRGTGVIYPNGDISICELYSPFANLHEYDWNFKKVWFSKRANLERKKVKGCFCTHGCWMFQNILMAPSEIIRFYTKSYK